MPERSDSSTPYWMSGLSTSGSISLGCALVAGRKRVPSPAAGKTALRTLGIIRTIVAEEGARSQEPECRSEWRSAQISSLGGRPLEASHADSPQISPSGRQIRHFDAIFATLARERL